MGDLSEHFSLHEFTNTSHTDLLEVNKKDAEQYIDNIKLVCTQLETLRNFICRPVIITSGFRNEALNRRVKGSKSSQHMTGSAADITVKDFEDNSGLGFMFMWCCRHLTYGQIILESREGSHSWIHIGLPRKGRKSTRYVFKDGIYKKP